MAVVACAPAALPLVHPVSLVPDRPAYSLATANLASPPALQQYKNNSRQVYLLDLPEELLLVMAEHLSATDIAFFEMGNPLLRRLLHNVHPSDLYSSCQQGMEAKWKRLFEATFNTCMKDPRATILQTRAALLAADSCGKGGWKRLFVSKTLKEREAKKEVAAGEAPWEQPCEFELQVALNGLVSGVPSGAQGLGLNVMFLLDGSGSVTEDDFNTMKTFIGTAKSSIATTCPKARAGILQFSNDVQVVAKLQPIGSKELDKKLEDMVRMNGGTNISMAIQKAGQLLKDADAALADHLQSAEGLESLPADPDVHTSRVVVLLTDGRVDHHQAQEAVSITGRLADEQANVSLHAFGVGRGVDKAELLRIIAACSSNADTAEEQYLGLRVLDEPPW